MTKPKTNAARRADAPAPTPPPAPEPITLGPRTVPAADLIAEAGPFVWGSHARSVKTSKPYPLQAEKIARIGASYAKNGIQPFTVTGRHNPQTGKIELLDCRHRVHALPKGSTVTVNVVSMTELGALEYANHSNAEGMGFSLMAALEQLYALVRFFAGYLPGIKDRAAQMPDFPAPDPGAQWGYTADLSGNPFGSHKKRGDWSAQSYTGQGLAVYAALSPATTQRCLKILAGLWTLDLEPHVVAGMTTPNALRFANVCSLFRDKRGSERQKDRQTDAIALVAEAFKAPDTAPVIVMTGGKAATTDDELANAIYAATKTTVKLVEVPKDETTGRPQSGGTSGGTARVNLKAPQRILRDLIELAAAVKKENANSDATTPTPDLAKDAAAALDLIAKYFKTTQRTDAGKVDIEHPQPAPVADLDTDTEPAAPLTDAERAIIDAL